MQIGMSQRCHAAPERFPDELTVRAARDVLFEDDNVPAGGGYEDRWAWVRVGPIPLAFPNSAARVRALRFHDIHHVVTGYECDWRGEAEIGAWEIASGCAEHAIAWILNAWVMAVGLVICPRRVLRAFLQGRHSGNCYRESYSDALLDTDLGTLRERLGLRRTATRATPGDIAHFALWCGLSALLLVGPPVLLLVVLL